MDIPRKTWKWRTQTWLVLMAGLTAILVALVASYALAMFRPTTDVRIGQSGVYSLWTAETDSDLYKGLSNIQKLPKNGGLLMDFKVPGYHGIVMRDMFVPLDIVWLNEAKEVVTIVKNVSADTPEATVYKPVVPARYVLELPAGSTDASAIKKGDRADFELGGADL